MKEDNNGVCVKTDDLQGNRRKGCKVQGALLWNMSLRFT